MKTLQKLTVDKRLVRDFSSNLNLEPVFLTTMQHTVQISRSERVTSKDIIEVGLMPTQFLAVTSSLASRIVICVICNDPRRQTNGVPNVYSGRGHTMVTVQLSHGLVSIKVTGPEGRMS